MQQTRVSPLNLPLDEHSLEHEAASERVCRICFDGSSVENELISPCRCTGSVEYVHEECIKTWVLSQNDDLDEAKCELCHTVLLMNYEVIVKCTCTKAVEEGLSACLFAPLLAVVIGLLSLIMYMLMLKYLDDETTDTDKVYTLVLFGICLVSSFILAGLIVNSIRQTYFVSYIQSWHILSQSFEEESEKRSELLSNTLVEHAIETNVMVLPRTIKVRGRSVSRPRVAPLGLNLMERRGTLVAFASSMANSQTSSVNVTQRRYGFATERPPIGRGP